MNWIDSGLVYIGDLKFIEGHIDTQFIYDSVRKKTNIYAEILLMQKCIDLYKEYIGSHEPTRREEELPLYLNKGEYIDIYDRKSKFFYENLLFKSKLKPSFVNKWMDKFYDVEVDYENVIKNKIVNVIDNKLAETNLKILYCTLPCGINLVKWKKIENSECTNCKQQESISHLIFECGYTKYLWEYVNKAFNIEISLREIILGDIISEELNMVISIIVYMIYKEWLMLSLDGKKRQAIPNLRYFVTEMKWYLKIFGKVDKLKIYVPSITCLVDIITRDM